MSYAAALAHLADPSAADRDAAPRTLLDQQMAALTRLTEIGMQIAEAAGRRAVAEDGGADGADAALSFARAARAVRLTIALQQRLAADLAALGKAERLARITEATRRRDRIHTRVETLIEAERADADEAEQLSSQVWERLTETEDDDILSNPIEEIVARICQDLGLSPAWAAAAFPPPEFAAWDGAPGPPGPPIPWANGLATKAAPAWATNGDRSGP